MGNVLRCCLIRLFWNKDIPDQIEERSPLLSRENSDVESLSPSRSDMLSSPVLDQDHLLYPDIVLSSSHLVANLDRDNLPQQSELVKSVNEEYQEGFEEEGMTSTRISQQEVHCLDRTQLCTTENEWPLLSSLHSWPSEQSDTVNLASQTLIHTHGQGTRFWQASPCQGVQLLGQGNGSHQIIFSEPKSAVAKVSPQTELEIIHVDERGLQDEDKEEAQLENGTEQMELNLVRSDQNVAQLGQDIALRAKYVRSSVAECEKSGVGSDEEEAGEHYPIQSGQTEAQYRPIIAQTEEVNHETVILVSQNGEHKEPSFVVRLQTNPDIRNREELTPQTPHFILDLDSIQTEGDVTEMTQIAKTLARKEQHISENEPEPEFAPNKQSVAELRSEEQDRKKTEDLNQGSKKNERFTLFVVDKLFLATPDITGPSPNNILKDQTELNELNRYIDMEFQEDPDSVDVGTSEDMGITIRIQAPGTEPTDFQASPLAMVQEIKQVLMDREETCHRTCFSLQLDGNTLDNFSNLKSITGLQEGSLLKIVEEPYTVREVRLHLRHFRDLLNSLDPTDAYNGIEGSSLSFLRFFTEERVEENSKFKKRGEELKQFNCSPPEYILPGTKECLLGPLQPQSENLKPIKCLKVLMTSSWNPPPGNRKIHGDLLYLNVLTMEDRQFSVTASMRGFYLNQSTTYIFNPKPENPSMLSHSLVDLLSQISPVFKKNFSLLLKRRTSTHPFERIGTPLQVFSWTAPALDHSMDCVRAEDASFSQLDYEGHMPGQVCDWNEELQSTRELPRHSLKDRLLRDRAIFKANSDFVTTATRGAMAVIDGNVMPINPSDEACNHMYVWNNIFFSFGLDGHEHYEELGGEAAAHVASAIDLNGVRAYSAVDADGLYLLGTVLVDYRGYRITAQSIVPGILERGQEQSVIYGSTDFGKTVVSNEQFLKLLDKPSKHLRVQRHFVLNKDDSVVELCSSVECKGIMGNDGRHYILDLLFTFPPDLNFLPVEGEELNTECQQLGFPLQHPHRLVCLRQELIEAFVKYRCHLYKNTASQGLDQESSSIKVGGSPHSSEAAALQPMPDVYNKGVDVGAPDKNNSSSQTLHSSAFDIHFNPDIFSPGVRFPKECSQDIQEQKQLLKDAAAFLVSNRIPDLIKSCADHTTMPTDGFTLTEALHQYGINIRYLGTVLEFIEKSPQKSKLDHVYRIALSELITRCTKHIFRTYLIAVESSSLSVSVSHFLNCFLSSPPDVLVTQQLDRLSSKRRSRRRRSRGSVSGEGTAVGGAWASLTSNELWRNIQAAAREYYHYCLPCNSIEQAVDKYGLQRITLLREIAIKTGIQLLIRDYQFDVKNKPVFTEEDILNIFPIIKRVVPKANDGIYLLHCGQASIQQGRLKEGCELISQAMGLFTNVYGALHQDVCVCLRLLGRIYYILGDYAEALSHQQKAVLISERVLGIDHPNTIQEYKHLGLYCFAGGQTSTALRLLYRARYLMLLVCGEDHPEMALLDSKIGLVLHGVMECDLALKFLENALALTSKYQGSTSLKMAQGHHLLAKVYESKGEFRLALGHEKERYVIYRNQVGETHEKTQESSEYLKHLTNQAVILQRTLNMIYKSRSSSSITPLTLATPSRFWIVEQLNLVTGIVLIPLSNKDLETLRDNTQKTSA
ncbi:clustered mitochondria protein homolog isoform X2 [Tachysurus fulvidraco]|uniref:clustered mitochondria protein homolog isoform X2 n=1 Tax=Tachysurus fulvidraco TaxID=1234273 RepID=UPI000F4D6C5C|nr:clustered mitochondria protein homolog isoform X2 [Tachysurus fulvidraco]